MFVHEETRGVSREALGFWLLTNYYNNVHTTNYLFYTNVIKSIISSNIIGTRLLALQLISIKIACSCWDHSDEKCAVKHIFIFSTVGKRDEINKHKQYKPMKHRNELGTVMVNVPEIFDCFFSHSISF